MPHYNVLFLDTGNSARSIMAEAIMNKRGADSFTAYSAGSQAKGQIHPQALRQLEEVQLPTDRLRSKSWDEFAKPGSPEMHFVFTLCDRATKEVGPVWPGHPMTGHWGVPDPAAVKGPPDKTEKAFRDAFLMLERRISLFLTLPLAGIDTLSLKKQIHDIGSSEDALESVQNSAR
jgi:arsenate reductase